MSIEKADIESRLRKVSQDLIENLELAIEELQGTKMSLEKDPLNARVNQFGILQNTSNRMDLLTGKYSTLRSLYENR